MVKPNCTLVFSVPGPVRDLRIEKVGTSFALLKWLPPEEPNGRLLGYDIGYEKCKYYGTTEILPKRL